MSDSTFRTMQWMCKRVLPDFQNVLLHRENLCDLDSYEQKCPNVRGLNNSICGFCAAD